jgi:exonuclease SbcC
MRFLRIRAQNVLSHVDTEIRLSEFDSAVIVGPNGVGKSSLLIDCPLIALFGSGRSSDLDGYIRNGADWAQFEFDFSTDQGIFRAVRKRSKKTARGTTVLEFYQIDAEGNVIRPLSAGSIGETQSLIKKTLGMEFDTLVRASIIEQGEADFFCEASPSERMELFSKVWDLEKYEDFEQMARDIWKEANERIKVLEERATTNSIAIREVPRLKEDLEKLQKKMDKQIPLVLGIEKKKGDLQKKIGVFDGLANELKKTNEFQAKFESEMKQIAGQHDGVMAKIDRFWKILKNRDVVVQKVEEEKTVEAERSDLEKKLKESDEKIEAARKDCDALRKTYQDKITGIEVERGEIDKDISRARAEQDTVNQEMAALGRVEERLERMRVDADKLKGVQCHPDFDPAYVNETCQFIKDAVEAKRKVPETESDLKTRRNAVEKKRTAVDLRLSTLDQKKKDCDARIAGLRSDLKKELEGKQSLVDKMVGDRSEINKKIDDTKARLEDLKRFTKLLPEISLAEEELPKLREEEKDLNIRCNSLSEDIDKQKKERARLTEQMKGRADVEKELQSTCNELNEATTAKEELAKNIGVIEATIQSAESLREQLKADEREIDKFGGRKALYQMLEDAFKQIPYMMVSRGIGAVESLANEILAMISSRGLRVRIETERMAKTTKKVRDEIHLVFEDEDGQKEYKFLSGGEKLRVALAVRLAIGEVFAHRRGVRVDSLLADEPFGPLDTEGIEDMKEAMRELKKRFRFMGVITHIERAQDIFPTRLMFERNSKGTTISVGEEYA